MLIDLLLARPRLAALASAVCLADAANCVRLGHDDWYFPASLAFMAALLVRDKSEPDR